MKNFLQKISTIVLSGRKLVITVIFALGGIASAIGAVFDLVERFIDPPIIVRPENILVSENGEVLSLDITNKGAEPVEIAHVAFKVGNTSISPYQTGSETFVLSSGDQKTFEIGTLNISERYPEELKNDRPFTVYFSFSTSNNGEIQSDFVSVAQYDIHTEKYQPLSIIRIPKDYVEKSKHLPR